MNKREMGFCLLKTRGLNKVRPEGAQLTKGFCNPSSNYFSDFHFILVHSFSLSLLMNKREMGFCLLKTRGLNKVRPEGAQLTKGFCNPSSNYFSDFHFYWFILSLSLF